MTPTILLANPRGFPLADLSIELEIECILSSAAIGGKT
jgi:hypothetical protein